MLIVLSCWLVCRLAMPSLSRQICRTHCLVRTIVSRFFSSWCTSSVYEFMNKITVIIIIIIIIIIIVKAGQCRLLTWEVDYCPDQRPTGRTFRPTGRAFRPTGRAFRPTGQARRGSAGRWRGVACRRRWASTSCRSPGAANRIRLRLQRTSHLASLGCDSRRFHSETII